MNACINCIHFSPATKGFKQLEVLHGRCFLTGSQKLDPLTGKVVQAFASNNRMSGAICGPDGHWFERDCKENDLRNEIAASGDC